MTRKTVLRVLVPLLVVVFIVLCSTFAFHVSQGVALSIAGRTNNAAGLPVMIFSITNDTGRDAWFCYETQYSSNGWWYAAESQRTSFVSGLYLPAKSAREFAFAAPAEGAPWRALVLYGHKKSKLSEWINTIFALSGISFRLNENKFLYSAAIEK